MLKIYKYPAEVLKQKALEVKLPLSEEEEQLIRDMWLTVQDIGVGLAAPQVGVSKKICIIHLDESMALKKDKVLDIVMINPIITFYSEVKCTMVEGCLSFPEEYYEIQRPENISVEFQTILNLEGFLKGQKPILKKKKGIYSSWMARVMQHEIDHLSGELFIFKGGKKIEQNEIDEYQVVD